MIEVIILLLGPSIFSLLLWSATERIHSGGMRKKFLAAVFIIFTLLVIAFEFLTPEIAGPAPRGFILAVLSIIAFSSAYPVVLAMNLFPGIFSEKGETLAAALVPLISIPFIAKLLISPEVWDGKTYGADYFFIKIPLVGWIIDPFTSGWVHTAGSNDPLPSLILTFGFFIQMIIVMLLVFWYFKKTVGCPGDISEKKEE